MFCFPIELKMRPWIRGFKNFISLHSTPLVGKFLALAFIVLVIRSIFFPTNLFGYDGISIKGNLVSSHYGNQRNKFVEVPQIVWGLNNQKIAFARACLTARMLNRTLLMPSLSASLFYKEIDQLVPISFDKVFQFGRFNSLCSGFVQLGSYSDIKNKTDIYVLQKGSGRKWTDRRDLDQLKQLNEDPYDGYEVIRIKGKNPFLWNDHWPVQDYARIFECLVLVDEYQKEADRVVGSIRMAGEKALKNKKLQQLQYTPMSVEPLRNKKLQQLIQYTPMSVEPYEMGRGSVRYVAVHMRIEIDWMIHCKKSEQRLHINEICSSKEEIVERVGKIVNSSEPTVVYLAVADSLLEDKSIYDGWKKGLIPLDKKKLGVEATYEKYPYLIKSAIDYEVCSRADVFVGNSFSTFSSLIVLERTQRLLRMGVTSSCGIDVRWPSYAYNIMGDHGGPQKWTTNMSDSSLQSISYGTNKVSC